MRFTRIATHRIHSGQTRAGATGSETYSLPGYVGLVSDVLPLLAGQGQLFASLNTDLPGSLKRVANDAIRECAYALIKQSGLRMSRPLRRRLRRTLLPRGARTAPLPDDSSDADGQDVIDRLDESSDGLRYSLYLAAILLAFVVVTAVRDHWMGTHVDEANWLMQTEHLQAGYFFHPPFLVYELFALKKLLGTSPFALRLGSLGFTTLSLVLIHAISMRLFGEQSGAFLATLLIAALPITNYWLTLGQQDPPMISFWLLTMYFVLRAVSNERPGYWYMAGVSAGFMLLCNLRSTLLPVGIFSYLLTSGKNRHWLARKEPYLGFAIMVAMFIPTLLWYAKHHFEPIIYQLKNRPGFMQFDLAGYINFVMVHVVKEMIVLAPLTYLLSAFGVIYGGYLSFCGKNADDRFKFLFWGSAPMVAFFTVTGGSSYWAVPGHLVSLMAAMGALPIFLSRREHLQRYSPRSVAVISTLTALLFTIGTLVIIGDSGKVDSEKLAGEVDRILGSLPAEDTYVASSHYFLPSLMYYYQKERPAGYTLAFQVYEHKALAAGRTSSYSPWVPLDTIAGKNIIFVVARMSTDGFEVPESYWAEKLEPYFERLDEPTVVVGRKRGESQVFYIFSGIGFKGPDERIDDNSGLEKYKTRNSSMKKTWF